MSRFKLLSAGLFVSFLLPGAALAIPPRVPAPKGSAFAQLSSGIDQRPGGLVKFERKDSLRRMSATDNTVIIDQDGTYLIIASPQITATKDGGCLDLWLILNGKDVPNSGVRSCQAKQGNTNVTVSQTIMFLNKGDRVQVKTRGNNAMLDGFAVPGESYIPSIILSVLGLTY